MNGQIAFKPYPSTDMNHAIIVQSVGSTLELLRPDSRIESRLPDDSYRNSQQGDVLSRQPGGSWECRPRGTSGAFEVYAANGALAVYCPEGQED